jgi:DNA-binding NarL/FixJ family response regulator
MAVIEIVEGVYKIRGEDTSVAGRRFELVEQFRAGTDGVGYVTVNGASCPGFPERKIRIRCQGPSSYTVVEGELPVSYEPVKSSEPEGVMSLVQAKVPDAVIAHESDETIIERTRQRFEVLKDMTKAVKEGTVRAMIVTGPPGVGKSFGVEEVLNRDDLFDQIGNRKPKYEVVKGAMSAVGLYAKLYEYSEKGNVIVFDDCDSVLLDDLSLNILKAALDTSKKRTISWNTDSRLLRSEGVPDKFEFKAGAIFITNIKFENVRSKKLQDHLAALESRCHYIDLQMDTDREKVLRIKQIVADGMLDSYEFEQIQKDEVIEFIMESKSKLRELSLRTVLKTADLRKSFPTTWKSMAEVTIMKRG